MKEFAPSTLTGWFIKNVTELKEKHDIKTDIQLATTINYPKSNLSAVLKGKRDIPVKYALEFARQFQLPSPYARLEIGLDPDAQTRKPEPLWIKPYNRPVIQKKDQSSYLKQYDNPTYIEMLNRYPLPQGVNIRGAEWRWFQAQGHLKQPFIDENDLLLGRFIVLDDWILQPKQELYIITTKKKLILAQLKEASQGHFLLTDTLGKQKTKVSWKNVNEVWRVKASVLKEKN